MAKKWDRKKRRWVVDTEAIAKRDASGKLLASDSYVAARDTAIRIQNEERDRAVAAFKRRRSAH